MFSFFRSNLYSLCGRQEVLSNFMSKFKPETIYNTPTTILASSDDIEIKYPQFTVKEEKIDFKLEYCILKQQILVKD